MMVYCKYCDAYAYYYTANGREYGTCYNSKKAGKLFDGQPFDVLGDKDSHCNYYRESPCFSCKYCDDVRGRGLIHCSQSNEIKIPTSDPFGITCDCYIPRDKLIEGTIGIIVYKDPCSHKRPKRVCHD